MKNFSYALIALMCFNLSHAQSDISSTSNHFVNTQWINMSMGAEAIGTGALSANPDLMNAIKQSQLFDLNWGKATMKLNDNFEIVEARYNPFNDAIEIKQNDKIVELPKSNNREIKFIDRRITYQAKSYYGSDGKIYTSYFIVNNMADDVTVLKKEWIEENPNYGKRLNAYMNVVVVTEQFKRKDYYYFIDENNMLFLLTTDRNLINNMYPNHAKSIIKYIRTNKLRSDDENDLITLAKYIKTLQDENSGM
ncbi:hypothetical protein FJ651_11075 [Paucihalobacter ruber]|uniref:Uncharacterized protein n=1 Tax=Paucihalobacter ruber TaxID=2567861 RepID=A0A506PG60_9FLAO|nr:hypothetical protein [Paucihalobacter ruber]TPV32843.1 hypothetical protein FJ651_11075 [Paucihalobacter ruber]